jgi:YebC/PmpR family DNA-binding regulatory protein
MSGHSHWATIKHKKGAIDAKRGKLFSKLSRAIIIAARHGGGDPETNLKLRYAIDKARQVSMPKDNIERAVKRGTGELEGLTFEEVTYEGYGPGGVAILVEVLTDNRNRTTSEIRKIFERSGGKMGSAGCVAYLFERKGLFSIDAQATDEDALLSIALDAGADDLKRAGSTFDVTCDPSVFAQAEEWPDTDRCRDQPSTQGAGGRRCRHRPQGHAPHGGARRPGRCPERLLQYQHFGDVFSRLRRVMIGSLECIKWLARAWYVDPTEVCIPRRACRFAAFDDLTVPETVNAALPSGGRKRSPLAPSA